MKGRVTGLVDAAEREVAVRDVIVAALVREAGGLEVRGRELRRLEALRAFHAFVGLVVAGAFARHVDDDIGRSVCEVGGIEIDLRLPRFEHAVIGLPRPLHGESKPALGRIDVPVRGGGGRCQKQQRCDDREVFHATPGSICFITSSRRMNW